MRNGEALVYAYVLDGQGGGKVVDWNVIDNLYCGYLTEINNYIQNDSPKFSLINAISEISVTSEFTTPQ